MRPLIGDNDVIKERYGGWTEPRFYGLRLFLFLKLLYYMPLIEFM